MRRHKIDRPFCCWWKHLSLDETFTIFRALAVHSQKKAVRALLRILTCDTCINVRLQVAAQVACLTDGRCIPALRKIALDESEDYALRCVCTEALASYLRRRVVQRTLSKLARDRNASIRVCVVCAIGGGATLDYGVVKYYISTLQLLLNEDLPVGDGTPAKTLAAEIVSWQNRKHSWRK